jgi:hypothetical protein
VVCTSHPVLSRRLLWVGHVSIIGEGNNAGRIWGGGKPLGKCKIWEWINKFIIVDKFVTWQ